MLMWDFRNRRDGVDGCQYARQASYPGKGGKEIGVYLFVETTNDLTVNYGGYCFYASRIGAFWPANIQGRRVMRQHSYSFAPDGSFLSANVLGEIISAPFSNVGSKKISSRILGDIYSIVSEHPTLEEGLKAVLNSVEFVMSPG